MKRNWEEHRLSRPDPNFVGSGNGHSTCLGLYQGHTWPSGAQLARLTSPLDGVLWN